MQIKAVTDVLHHRTQNVTASGNPGFIMHVLSNYNHLQTPIFWQINVFYVLVEDIKDN